LIGDNSVIAVIPARGGSKGLPGKNLRLLGGRPLLAWSVTRAHEAATINRSILSSDDEEIIAAAESIGCETQRRPADLATDEATTLDVIRYVMQCVPRHEFVVVLQPTSPLRRTEDIDGAVRLCRERNVHSVVSVCLADKSPEWMYTVNIDGAMTPVLSSPASASRRQDLLPVYVLNGAIYVARWSWLEQGNGLVTEGTLAYPMPKECSIDIDTALDLAIAEFTMNHEEQ
jgi:CMP-N,N'-diacetyllegionaminic acid synthase